MSYAQNGEDLIIADYFKSICMPSGLLLDIGANDGVTFSNSHLLIENGWAATLVEPSLAFNKLEELYNEDDYTGIVLNNVAISSGYGTHSWYEVEDSLLSTCEKYLADRWGRKYETKSVKTVPYAAIADHYDFITIDAEGNDWLILQQIDLTHTHCLCIEHSNQFELITEYCAQFGLKEIHRNCENIIFCK